MRVCQNRHILIIFLNKGQETASLLIFYTIFKHYLQKNISAKVTFSRPVKMNR